MNKTQTLARLKSLGRAQTRKTYARHGGIGKMYGVSYADLGKLRREIKVDHRLAEQLWASGVLDAMVLATMVADGSRMNMRALEAWLKSIDNHFLNSAIADITCRSPVAVKCMRKWMKARAEWKAALGWYLVARLAGVDGAFPDEEADGYLETIEAKIHISANKVRQSMNQALIAIGLRSAGFQRKAVAAAKRIGPVEVDHGTTSCKTPDAVTYIEKAAARKKQKSAGKPSRKARAPRSGSKSAGVLLLVASLVGCAQPQGTSSRPTDAAPRLNLVAIVTDDQGRWAMGAYDNPEIRTPNMDRIAREGALFRNAFVATPVCSPSRATYLTGRYPTELGITDWIAPSQAEDGLGLAAETWPQALQRHGYRTALVGKWHLGQLGRFHPTELGFDHFTGFLSGANRPMNPTLEVAGEEIELEGPLPDLLTDDAIQFVERNANRPFALCLHFRAPHLPYGPVPKSDSAPYADLDPAIPDFPGLVEKQIKKKTRQYYGSITSIDRNIGRLLEALERLGRADDTLVIFTSDHGYNEGRHGVNTKGNGHWIVGGRNGPKRPNMWDTSMAVPLAIRWPGTIEPGTEIDDLVSQVDFYRTVLGALGVPVPLGAKARGTDFSPLLRGEAQPEREAIFGQYDLHNHGLAYMRMVRTQEFKLVRHFRAHFMDEMYDLTADPAERHNLLHRKGDPPEEIEELRARLDDWMTAIDDPMLER